MPKNTTDKAAVEKYIQIRNEMIDNANTLIERFEQEWSAFGKKASWNIGELIHLIAEYRVMQTLCLTKYPFHRSDLERHEITSLINNEYNKNIRWIRYAILRGIWSKDILVITPREEDTTNPKEKSEDSYSRVAMVLDLATFRLDDKYVDPQSFLTFAEKKCLDIPDMLRYRGLPAKTQKSRRINTNRGNEALWRAKYAVEEIATKYMAGEVLRGCTCRHDKLAYFTLENAKNDEGILLKEYEMPPQYNFRAALKEIASTMVPEERQLGNPNYKAERCICELPEHPAKIPRRKKTQAIM